MHGPISWTRHLTGLRRRSGLRMNDLFKHFDPYTLRARLFPALIAGLPTLALLAMVVPWDRLGLPHAVAMATALVLLFAFADVARRTGKRMQAKLGTGATPDQWRRDNPDLAGAAKDRYRAFVAQMLKLPAPSEDEERTDPVRAREFYLGAGNWLREHARDSRIFRILFEENVTYGFRRNLLGLKVIALACNVAVAAVCAGVLRLRPFYFAALPGIDEKMVVVLAAVLLHSAYLLLAANKAGVREASQAYGRELILSGETLMARRAPAPKVGARKNGKG